MFQSLKALLLAGGDAMFAPSPVPELVVDARAQPTQHTPSQRAAYRRNLLALEALFRQLHHADTRPEDKPLLMEQIGRRQRVLERSGLPVPVRLSECQDALRVTRAQAWGTR